MVAFIAENITAFQAGQPIPHFYMRERRVRSLVLLFAESRLAVLWPVWFRNLNAIAKSERSHCFQPCLVLMNPSSLVHRLF